MAHPKILCQLREVCISDILHNNRARADLQDLEQLKKSIQEEGLIHPIAVMEEGKAFRLLGGGRRLQACTDLGWSTIACNVYPTLDELDQKTIELKENLIRTSLTPFEEAKLTREIHLLQVQKYGKADKQGGGHRLDDTASLLGKSRATVIQDLKLAEMMEYVPDLTTCKTKQEALKMVDRAKRALDVAKEVQKFEEQTGLIQMESEKGRLLKSYLVGDFFQMVEKIPDGTVTLVELDPVYHIELNKTKKLLTGGFDDRYEDAAPEEYADFLKRVLQECYRVMSPNSWLICWYSIRWHHETTARAIEEAGFTLNRLPCFWNKKYGQSLRPEFNLPSCYDTFFYARKGIPSLRKQGRSNVYECKPVVSQRKVHTIERPIQLLQDILSTFVTSGDSVLVPFAGSGNTLLAAGNLHMPCIGYDLQQDFCNEYKKKVNEGIPGMYLSPLIGGGLDALV